jgi:hypothetical protein
LPWLGWIPDDLASCPPAAVRRLANRSRGLLEVGDGLVDGHADAK